MHTESTTVLNAALEAYLPDDWRHQAARAALASGNTALVQSTSDAIEATAPKQAKVLAAARALLVAQASDRAPSLYRVVAIEAGAARPTVEASLAFRLEADRRARLVLPYGSGALANLRDVRDVVARLLEVEAEQGVLLKGAAAKLALGPAVEARL